MRTAVRKLVIAGSGVAVFLFAMMTMYGILGTSTEPGFNGEVFFQGAIALIISVAVFVIAMNYRKR